MHFARHTLIATACTSAMLWAPGAEAQSGKTTVDRLVQIFSSWSGRSTDRNAYREAAKYIDYSVMAERSLAPAEWRKLTQQQKTEFSNTLRTLIEERYYTRWHKIFNKGTLAYVGEDTAGRDTVVNTRLTIGKKVDPLVWRMKTAPGGESKVVSLSMGDSDLLRKLNNRLQGKLNKYGFNGLLTWMKNKANIESGETATASASLAH